MVSLVLSVGMKPPAPSPFFSITSMPLCAGIVISRSYLASVPSSLFSTWFLPSTSFMLNKVS